MAQLVYIDETGSVGTAGARQPQLILVAAIVDESRVRPLAEQVRELAVKHLGWLPTEFEFHGHEVWNGTRYWSDHSPSQLLAVYEDVIGLLNSCGVSLAHATINKEALHNKYAGGADENAYRLALQFLLEKVDRLGGQRKLLVADEAKEQELRAIRMVSELQLWGWGEVPGIALNTIIDSLHFVRSRDSAGVQIADMVAFIIQRVRRGPEHHPDAVAGRERIAQVLFDHVRTYRTPWPDPPAVPPGIDIA